MEGFTLKWLRGRTKRVLSWAYGYLPEAAKTSVSQTVHGETKLQRLVTERLLRARVRLFGADGSGDAVGGSVLSPKRAIQVEAFDSWAHVDFLGEQILHVLRDADIPVYPLPHHDRPAFVIADEDWGDAWRAISSSPATALFWVRSGRLDVPAHSVRSPLGGTSAWLFQRLVGPSGAPLASVGLRVRLLQAHRVTPGEEVWREGAVVAPGTLLLPAGSNSFGSILTVETQTLLADDSNEWPMPLGRVSLPVDIVYTWVDGDDSEWQSKRAAHRFEENAPADANIASRYKSRDELRYSLRSVEMYASWVNHIYVVTDQQCPEWLDKSHPKITVVDHSQIFEPDELPVFNSHAIEARLHRIEGLAENFIYMNDDVFLGRPVRPELFFQGDRMIKYFPSKALVDPGPAGPGDTAVTSAAKNNRSLIEAEFGRTFGNKLKHTPHAQLKSVLQEMEKQFPRAFRQVGLSKFRSHSDLAVLSGLAQRYAEATSRGLVGAIRYGYVDISKPALRRVLNRWARNRSFDVFCLNDTAMHEVDEEARDAIVHDFLESYFPARSSMELSQQAVDLGLLNDPER